MQPLLAAAKQMRPPEGFSIEGDIKGALLEVLTASFGVSASGKRVAEDDSDCIITRIYIRGVLPPDLACLASLLTDTTRHVLLEYQSAAHVRAEQIERRIRIRMLVRDRRFPAW